MAAYLDRAAPLSRVGAPYWGSGGGGPPGCIGATCSDLSTVVRAFIEIVNAEVARARDAITTFDQQDHPGRIDFLTIAERMTIVEGWLRARCPDWEKPEEERTCGLDLVEPEDEEDLKQPVTDQDPGFSYSVPLTPTGQTPHLRSGEWAGGLEYLAIHGLQEPDSVGRVLYEMATFLYWVELFVLPAGERERRIVDLLKTFDSAEHNGMVDRLNNGQEHQVMRQVEQAVRAVARNR